LKISHYQIPHKKNQKEKRIASAREGGLCYEFGVDVDLACVLCEEYMFVGCHIVNALAGVD